MTHDGHDTLAVTREKLRLLEERYAASRAEADVGERAKELSLRSLKRLINQLREDIARAEASALGQSAGG